MKRFLFFRSAVDFCGENQLVNQSLGTGWSEEKKEEKEKE
jgi:hypothetical protein